MWINSNSVKEIAHERCQVKRDIIQTVCVENQWSSFQFVYDIKSEFMVKHSFYHWKESRNVKSCTNIILSLFIMLVLNWVNIKEIKKTNENLICNSIQTMIFDHRRQVDYPSQYDLTEGGINQKH